MSRMRMRIAERLKEAQNTNAMLTTFNEIDMRWAGPASSGLLGAESEQGWSLYGVFRRFGDAITERGEGVGFRPLYANAR